MEENSRIEWEDENMDVMKDLLVKKTKSCELFRIAAGKSRKIPW